MANNQHVNKIIYGTQTLIDLTADTVTPEKILKDYTAHDASGATITGTCEYDVNSTDANAVVGEVLKDRTFYARGTKLTGTMPNRGAVTGKITTKDGIYSIEQGYHDGSGTVAIDSTEQAKIIPANIKSGVEILGVAGSYGGEEITAQTKTVTPTTSIQTVLPDSNYDYLSQVTVNAIPYVETDNSAGGKTVTIG